jgi:1-acyl-sn-glycerol-3-phosphate acyltransferase
MAEKKKRKYWYWIARNLCRFFCFLFFRLRTYGLENIPRQGSFILISNHQSFLDPLFCGVRITRPLVFMARDSLFTNRFFGGILRSVDAIPVKRDHADLGAVKNIINVLKSGSSVCLFPEGTRSRDGKIKALKPGFGLLSRRGNATIVPVVIDGAFECWPRDKKIFSIGKTIDVTYGKPVTVEKVQEIGDEKLAQMLTDELRQMQNESRIRQEKEPLEY